MGQLEEGIFTKRDVVLDTLCACHIYWERSLAEFYDSKAGPKSQTLANNWREGKFVL